MTEPWRASGAAHTRALTLRVDHATAEVLRAFAAEDVAALLIKGASVVRWLYDDTTHRGYGDTDILVAPASAARSADVLTGLGFEPTLDETAMPEWWREHAVAWFSADLGAVVDLHHDVPGTGAGPQRTWDVLSRGAESMVIGGFPANVPALPARALLLAISVARAGARPVPARAHLERALAVLDDDAWRAAADLAAELEAVGALSAGLRLVPGGDALAGRLGLPEAVSTEVALWIAGAPYQAQTFERLAHAPGVRAKAAIVWRKLVPPAAFMRVRGPGSQSRAQLARAYARRPLWVLAVAPRAFVAWRRARRAVSRG